MKKILALLIIAIALIGVSIVSASSDVDGFNGEVPIMDADFFQDSLSFPFSAINIPLTCPFSVPVGGDTLEGPLCFSFVAAADAPVNNDGSNDSALSGSFSLPIHSVNVPLNGPLSLPIVGVDVENSLGLPIIGSDIPF